MQLNQGQSTGPAGVDVDVMPVWRQGITGKGVVVSILDDGVDHTHPDLQRQLCKLSFSLCQLNRLYYSQHFK